VQKAADIAMQRGSRLYTDSASSYRALKGYVHDFVNHTKKEYLKGARDLCRSTDLTKKQKVAGSTKL